MLRRATDVRRRIDAIRARFGRETVTSVSLVDAVEQLDRAVEQHFAKQAATRVTADRLVGALDVIPQGIVLADGEGQIVFRNQTAAGYLSARHGDALVGSLIAELIAEAVTGRDGSRTIELYGPPRRSLQLRAVPLGDSGAGAFLVVEDISERQRLEAVRRDFVANISHELKTPVGALGLLAETMADEEDAAVLRRMAERMQKEAFRVGRTIDDLLQLSQIEASELPVHHELAVSSVLEEVAERSRSAAELRSVELVVEEPSADATVVGDRRQLVSALSNLVENAVKYSDEGGAVVLRAAEREGRTEIDVVDHGIGIPARDLERIFERFYRVDRARSRDTGGTGLGLAIVRHVAQNHQGEVRVASLEGEGSTFTLSLPSTTSSPSTDPGEPPAASEEPHG
jgi:two-component system sensor histidine kinase SenX3